MSFFGQTKRGSSAHSSRRYGNPLPLSNSDVLQEKFGHHGGASHNRSHHRRGSSFTQPLATSSTPNGWFTVLYIPIPKFLQRSTSSSSSASSPIAGLSGRSRASSIDGNGYYGPSGLGTRAGGPSGGGARQHVPLYLPIPRPVWQRLPGAGRPTPLKLCIYLFIIIGAVVVVLGFKKNDGGKTTWSPPFQGEPSTLVLTREEVARIWQWELLSGHHPSVKQSESSDPQGARSVPKAPIVDRLCFLRQFPNRYLYHRHSKIQQYPIKPFPSAMDLRVPSPPKLCLHGNKVPLLRLVPRPCSSVRDLTDITCQ